MNQLAQDFNLHIPGMNTITNPVTNPAAQSPGGLISVLIPYIYTVAGVLVFIYLLIGGFRFLTSGGEPKAVADARENIYAALIGFAIIFGSYFLLKLAETIFGFRVTGLVPVAYAQVDIGQTYNFIGRPIGDTFKDITDTSRITSLIVRLFFAGAAVIFVFVLIIGSLRYIFSGGDAQNTAGARSQLLYASVGLLIVIFAYVIVKLFQDLTGIQIV